MVQSNIIYYTVLYNIQYNIIYYTVFYNGFFTGNPLLDLQVICSLRDTWAVVLSCSRLDVWFGGLCSFTGRTAWSEATLLSEVGQGPSYMSREDLINSLASRERIQECW